MGYIYKITNNITQMGYVGQTKKTPEKRFNDHKIRRNDGNYFHNAIGKYGKENFTLEILCETNNLDLMEMYFIKIKNTLYPNGYNLTSGGQACGTELQIVKDKIGYTQKGRISPNKGKKFGPNPKISEIMKKRGCSHLHTPEVVAKRNSKLKGIKRSEEFSKSCSERYTGRWNVKLAKPILITHKDTGIQVCFRSVCEAARAGYPRSAISNYLTGRSKSMRLYDAEYIMKEKN